MRIAVGIALAALFWMGILIGLDIGRAQGELRATEIQVTGKSALPAPVDHWGLVCVSVGLLAIVLVLIGICFQFRESVRLQRDMQELLRGELGEIQFNQRNPPES